MKNTNVKLLGMPWPLFLIVGAIVIGAAYLGLLPESWPGQVPFLLVLGTSFGFIGDRIPFVRKYLGGGSIVILIGCMLLVFFGLLPESIPAATKEFYGSHFADYCLSALVVGSIFGLDRKILSKAALRYFPCIIAATAAAMVLATLVGLVFGYTPARSILYIVLPIMGGGTAAGAVPMATMFAETLGEDAGSILSAMTPAVTLGNVAAIFTAVVLDKLGNRYPSMTGNGELLRVKGDIAQESDTKDNSPLKDYSEFATGMVVCCSVFILARFLQKFVLSNVHYYAWAVVLAVVLKLSGILPENVVKSCVHWYQFTVKNFSNLFMAALGIALMQLQPILDSLSLTYVVMVLATVLGAVLGAGLVGKLVGFYPVESAITGGLCMANMGGSGDLATLGACNRMNLMAFATVSSRLGGVFILILGGFLAPLLG